MKEEVNMQKDYSYIKVIIIAVLLALFVRSFLFNGESPANINVSNSEAQ